MKNNNKIFEFKIGEYVRKFEIRDSHIGSFLVKDKIFNCISSNHALEMLRKRNISKYHVFGSIVSLGEKLIEYNNNNKHIMISDDDKGITTVFTIENYIVVIITIIDKGEEVYISRNSHKETIIEKYKVREVG